MNGRDSRTPAPASAGHLNPHESPPVHRYPPPSDVAHLVRHVWIPEWDLPDGVRVTARVLTYPALNVVVDENGAALVGPATRASGRTLEGRGWAVGLLLRPSATTALGRDAASLVDAVEPLDEPALVGAVSAAMAPGSPDRHATAVARIAAWLRDRAGPSGPQGRLADAAVELVESAGHVPAVAELAAALDVSPRTLQRAVRRCTGFTPAEVVRRRRLQDAAARLRTGEGVGLADVAADTGYADHAHMTREFRAVLDERPSSFRAR